MKLFFKCTSRGRPEKMKRAIDSIVNLVSSECDYFIQVSVDDDDYYLPRYYELIGAWHEIITGSSKNKIDAINRDLDLVDQWWDILINVSDDQVFIKKDFDLDILHAFVHNTDLFVHFPDGNQGDLATMSIIGRKYFERDGYIYNPEYKSVYCDNEAQDVAKLRGCYKFVNLHILNHLHPAWGKAEIDEQYKRTEAQSVYFEDRETYVNRAAKNFYL